MDSPLTAPQRKMDGAGRASCGDNDANGFDPNPRQVIFIAAIPGDRSP